MDGQIPPAKAFSRILFQNRMATMVPEIAGKRKVIAIAAGCKLAGAIAGVWVLERTPRAQPRFDRCVSMSDIWT